jgi:general secretion pathway protein G
MAFCAYCGSTVGEVSYRPCPSCGNPSNGAPRPNLPRGGNNAAVIVIFVIVGGLIAVAILGILAAIAIPNLLTAMQRAKQKRTMADVRSVATAVEAYAVDAKQYPSASSVEALQPLLAPKYIRTLPVKDGWGHPFRYTCTPEGRCDTYVLSSAGKDGVFEVGEGEPYEPGPTTNFDNDIVFSNGQFVRYPEGVQVQ